ncbi:hypothetical protein B0H14DRAFT_2630620 [Mycena olivaceomarginata]|nr:hypothetical protein B0H14DRAFT_2630620 [Mycena olivaceomarginata]
MADPSSTSRPRRHVARAPLRAIVPRPNVDLESQRTAQRDADRERQLALQETPSRRRVECLEIMLETKIGLHRLRRLRADILNSLFFAGVGTPPDSQRLLLPPNKSTLARRARRERDRQERERQAAATPPAQQRPTVRETVQRARREGERQRQEREQQEREERAARERERVQGANQLLTPPATNRERANVPEGEW